MKKLLILGVALLSLISLTSCNKVNDSPSATPDIEESKGPDLNVSFEEGKIYNNGDKCPTLDFNQIFKKDIYNLSEDYGRVIVLNFWSYDCKYCLRELPGFINLEKKYSNSLRFNLIHEANTYYDYTKQVKAYIEGNLSDFNANFLYEDKSNRLYYALGGGLGYPFTVILNKEGTIVEKILGAINEEKLEKILLKYI